MAYFAGFYLTICLHITPMDIAGKILDLFLIIGENTVHYILMGVLTNQRQKLLALENEQKVIDYLKNDMMKDLFQNDSLGGILRMDNIAEFYNPKGKKPVQSLKDHIMM